MGYSSFNSACDIYLAGYCLQESFILLKCIFLLSSGKCIFDDGSREFKNVDHQLNVELDTIIFLKRCGK